MDLTPQNKARIDGMSYEQLLGHWRFAPVGDPWFQGETGDYWKERMKELRARPETDHVGSSKSLGWEG